MLQLYNLSTLMWLILLTHIIIAEKDVVEPKSQDFFPYFNTKTAYENVHGKITIPNSSCKPIQIWMLIRHGTRYPKVKHLTEFTKLRRLQTEIIQNHKNKVGQLNSNNLKILEKWRLDSNINEKMAAILTPGAEEDIRSLAKRLKSAYPDLLGDQPKKTTDYIFRATNTPRTQATLKIFLNTLFGNSNIITPMQSLEQDPLLMPFKNSTEWKISSEALHSKDEKKKFQNGPEMKKLLIDMSRRLGFNQTLELDLIETMHKMCGFETSWYKQKRSTWCTLFTIDELKVLEFYQDLSSYYRIGPGRPMSSRFGCRMMKDMFQHFKKMKTAESANEPKGIFYFGHSSSIQMLLSAFKIGREPKLLSTSYNSAEKRTYRTSLLVPFTTNVIATLYKCSETVSTYKVMFHVAERPMAILDCPNENCDVEELLKKFQSVLDQCI